MPINRPACRRGLVMLLVLISLAMAVILASAYLASRDNSVPLSRNAAASAEARWAALSAGETALAILQTQADWRAMSQGVLLDDHDLAGATTRAEARDLETAAAPSPTTRYARVTASAEVDQDDDGVMDGRESVRFVAYVPTVPDPYAVVDLSDFAVFASKAITLTGDARIERWPLAPLSALRRRVHLGTNSNTSGTVSVLDQAACVDCTVHKPPISSPTLVINPDGPAIAQVQMPFPAHFPKAYDIGAELLAAITTTGNEPDFILNGGTDVWTTHKAYHAITIRNGGRLTLRGDIFVSADYNFSLMDSTNVRLIIDGHVTLVVFNDLKILSTAAIELLPGSTLDLYVRDDLEITDGYIGEARPDNLRDHTGMASYFDVNRIGIFTMDPNSSDHDWFLHSNSVVKGNIYGTLIKMEISGDSAVYGRLAVEGAAISDNSGVFYDHAIDQRQGFTNPLSPLYAGSNLNTALAPESLDPGMLQEIADMQRTTLRANGVDYGPPPSPPPPPPPPGTPTPRPVQVEPILETFGADMQSWEDSGSSG